MGCSAPLSKIVNDKPSAIPLTAPDFSGALPISPRIIKGQ
jgi:hypothetical protein